MTSMRSSRSMSARHSRDSTRGMQALKRIAQPEDIADAIAFLASNSAWWISGDTLGWMAARNSNNKGRRK